MVTEGEVMQALKKVYDPELGVNVVDLGLIYDLNLAGERVAVKMTLTTQGCPLHDSIARGVKTAVGALPGVKEVDVDLVWEPAWTPDRMTDAARKELGY